MRDILETLGTYLCGAIFVVFMIFGYIEHLFGTKKINFKDAIDDPFKPKYGAFRHYMKCGKCGKSTGLHDYSDTTLYEPGITTDSSLGIFDVDTGTGFALWRCRKCNTPNAVAKSLYKRGIWEKSEETNQ